MKEIKSKEDIKEALRRGRSVIMFGKYDCLHCTIVRNCIESVERHYPLIDFYFTEDRQMADARHIDGYPVTIFYEHGIEQGRLIGSGKINILRDLFNLWFKKD